MFCSRCPSTNDGDLRWWWWWWWWWCWWWWWWLNHKPLKYHKGMMAFVRRPSYNDDDDDDGWIADSIKKTLNRKHHYVLLTLSGLKQSSATMNAITAVMILITGSMMTMMTMMTMMMMMMTMKSQALSVLSQHREPRRNLLISKLPFTTQCLMPNCAYLCSDLYLH